MNHQARMLEKQLRSGRPPKLPNLTEIGLEKSDFGIENLSALKTFPDY